jgi:uncharacterized repeat protein (TIGR03803 family)
LPKSNSNAYEVISMNSKKFADRTTTPLLIFVSILMLAAAALASELQETALHSFRSGNNDGLAPYGRVISDAAGNLYGTTRLGGTSGAGTVFELTKSGRPAGWTETVLYNFTGSVDGSHPDGGLIFDAAGNLYGTANHGGAFNAGAVFQLALQGGTWTETVLYSFAGGRDGQAPQGDLIFDQAGNLYGTTTRGGSPGKGIVFELTPAATKGVAWTETILHRFSFRQGNSPRAAVVFDQQGSLYLTVANGGGSKAGAVLRLKPPATKGGAWTAQTLYTFTGGADGLGPLCNLIFLKGNLYGTTVIGGASGVGTVFELKPPSSHRGPWTETVLHSFTCGSDGCYPWAGLTMDKNEVFYGTTQFGGLPSNGGTVFQVKKDGGVWTESVLYSFDASLDQLSAAGLLLGDGGTLFGTTIGANMAAGTVFELQP